MLSAQRHKFLLQPCKSHSPLNQTAEQRFQARLNCLETTQVILEESLKEVVRLPSQCTVQLLPRDIDFALAGTLSTLYERLLPEGTTFAWVLISAVTQITYFGGIQNGRPTSSFLIETGT